MKDYIREHLDESITDIMVQLMSENNIMSGDIAPEQQLELDTHIDAIVELLVTVLKQNQVSKERTNEA